MPASLIVRLPNWLGDTVMAVPALRALRGRWPGVPVALAGPWAGVLAGQGLGDVLIEYPRGWRGRLRAGWAARAVRAEVAVLLPNSLEAALAARMWGARRVVGYATDGRGWLLTDPLPVPPRRAHQVDEYLALAERLDAGGTERVPRLSSPTDGTAARRARALAEDALGGQASRPLAGVHLGAAGGVAKTWPPGQVAALCRRLAKEGVACLLLGPAAEAATAAVVQAQAPAASLVGRDEPECLPALMAGLDVLVSGDTGVAHLAAALDTPVVTLFGPTDPTLSAPRGPATIVAHAVPCAPCFYRRCPIDHACMRGIAPDLVAERVLASLAAATGAGRR